MQFLDHQTLDEVQQPSNATYAVPPSEPVELTYTPLVADIWFLF